MVDTTREAPLVFLMEDTRAATDCEKVDLGAEKATMGREVEARAAETWPVFAAWRATVKATMIDIE
jgi:hypothetical protein